MSMLKNQYNRALCTWWKKSKELGQKYHGSALYFFVDRFFSRIRYGATSVHDYEFFKMYSLNHFAKNNIYTEGRYVRSCKWLFTPDVKSIFESKIGFMTHFTEFHKRDYVALPCKQEQVIDFLRKHNGAFIKKDVSNGGYGVAYVTLESINDSDVVKSISSFYGVLDEPVIQHPEMMKLNPSSVTTVRVSTMVENDGTIKFLGFVIRIGKAGNRVDNISAGGAIFQVDGEAGVVVGYGKDYSGHKYLFSPTGVLMPGFHVPYWTELVGEVRKAASKYPNARLVGWDIAIGENGPVFIEANLGTGPITIQFDNWDGLWNYIKQQKYDNN